MTTIEAIKKQSRGDKPIEPLIFEKHVAVRLLLNIIHTLSSHLEKANRVNSKNAKLVKELEGDKEAVATE